MGPNRLPSFVYLTPCKLMNYWVVLLFLYLVFGLMILMNYDHALLCTCSIMIYYCRLLIVHNKIILLIGTWSLT
jgi:hypothetical protein